MCAPLDRATCPLSHVAALEATAGAVVRGVAVSGVAAAVAAAAVDMRVRRSSWVFWTANMNVLRGDVVILSIV